MNKNRIFMAEKISTDIHEMVLDVVNNLELKPEEKTAIYTNLTLLVAEHIMKNTAIIADYCSKQETEKKGGPNRMR